MSNLKNPKEQVYLLLFGAPMNFNEISKKLYGKKNTKVSSYLTELENEGWLEYKRNYPRFIKGKKIDKRENYYISTYKGFFYTIQNKLSNEDSENLTHEEEKKLKEFLKSKWFNDFINERFKKMIRDKEERTIDNFLQILSYHCMYLFIGFKYYKAKWGYDANDPKLINELINHSGKKELTEPIKLGVDLLAKLAQLNNYADIQFMYYDTFVRMVEKANNISRVK